MPISEFVMTIFNVILIIISFCSIFNLIAMICSEITISTAICIILFIAMFVAQGSFSFTANQSPFITSSYWEDGKEYILSQEPDPNYPGDNVVKIAKILYLVNPQGQAMDIGSVDTKKLYVMPIYSSILIVALNILGVYVFSKKELK